MKDQLRKLDALLEEIQEDHRDYTNPYLDNEKAMRERKAKFLALSNEARDKLDDMEKHTEKLTEVSAD